MELNYKKMGEGKPLLILHGLFGSSDNWYTHGKHLAENFEVYLIDQRNHGDSDWSNQFDYDIMANDLHEFITKFQLDNCNILGHSMGGKTAMRYAQLYPEKIDKLISVDMGVKEYPITHAIIIEGLESIDVSAINSRSEANRQLAQYVEGNAVRQFLLKNLKRQKEGGYQWKINIPVLKKQLPVICSALPNQRSNVSTLFISGGRSEYILPEDLEDIKSLFPFAQFHTIESAGHWIHAETPAPFMNIVLQFLNGK